MIVVRVSALLFLYVLPILGLGLVPWRLLILFDADGRAKHIFLFPFTC